MEEAHHHSGERRQRTRTHGYVETLVCPGDSLIRRDAEVCACGAQRLVDRHRREGAGDRNRRGPGQSQYICRHRGPGRPGRPASGRGTGLPGTGFDRHPDRLNPSSPHPPGTIHTALCFPHHGAVEAQTSKPRPQTSAEDASYQAGAGAFPDETPTGHPPKSTGKRIRGPSKGTSHNFRAPEAGRPRAEQR